MNPEKLIKECRKNNLKAQSTLYQTYKNTLFSLCLKYCRNIEEAEDNLQDSFIEIFNNIKKYSGKGSFEGWMKRITINKAIDKYKKKDFINVVLNNDILEDNDTTINETEAEIPLKIILKFVQNLPNRYRLVFNLYELDGYSHKEIAELLQISESTSKSNLHRAKLILKEKIKEIKSSQTKII